jgi:glycolate oxidase iron-sulfur subunit
MQTNFTAAQLSDPDTAVANQVLRSCVHCGLCTATCPTFQLLGDELDGPRGRIYLIKDMLETNRPATAEVVLHVDRCLSCLSCMTTCPSDVHYMHLVDHARAYIERTYRRPLPERFIRGLLGWVIPRPGVFRIALACARLTGPLAGLIPGQSMFARRLRAITALAPANVPGPDPNAGPRVHQAEGIRKTRVALLAGCAQKVLAPEINAATIRLLTRLGCEVVVAKGAGCCGSLNHHMGQHTPAMALARANIEAWSKEIDNGGLDAVVINASGCGTTVKDYGFMFRTEPAAIREKAECIAGIAVDITELLTRIGYAPTRPNPGLRVAYHSACSLQHGQQITNEPKALLRKAGFRVVEPPEGHLCCGSAGTYNMLQPVIATKLRTRKLRNIAKTKPDLIAAGNIGCITQLSGGALPVVHTVALLDWMAGGPRPDGVPEETA